MVEQNQSQEQTEAMMVQAMSFAVVVSVIAGIAMVANVLLKVIESIGEAKGK